MWPLSLSKDGVCGGDEMLVAMVMMKVTMRRMKTIMMTRILWGWSLCRVPRRWRRRRGWRWWLWRWQLWWSTLTTTRMMCLRWAQIRLIIEASNSLTPASQMSKKLRGRPRFLQGQGLPPNILPKVVNWKMILQTVCLIGRWLWLVWLDLIHSSSASCLVMGHGGQSRWSKIEVTLSCLTYCLLSDPGWFMMLKHWGHVLCFGAPRAFKSSMA